MVAESIPSSSSSSYLAYRSSTSQCNKLDLIESPTGCSDSTLDEDDVLLDNPSCENIFH